jgi:ElaB/YqjD/DUF883 family membrane-anchored ribosome-binding protein
VRRVSIRRCAIADQEGQSGSTLTLSGRSEFARELATLDPKVRSILGLPDATIMVVDFFIAMVRLLIDDTDRRPWHDRLNDLNGLVDELDPQLQVTLKGLEQLSQDPSSITRKLKSPGFQDFVHKLLGEAKYTRLIRAVKADGAALAVGVRRGIRSLMPLALALDNCMTFVTREQIAQIKGFSQFSESLLRTVLVVDQAVDKVFQLDLPVDTMTQRVEELEPLVEDIADDITGIAERVHEVLSGRSSEVLLELSEQLSRKVRGARDALDHSADGVSQAANSLVEFVDRLLRDAYSEGQVISWVSTYRPDEPDLLYTADQSGRVRPTKRGQALCFVYMGKEPGESFVFNEMAVVGLTTARARLQKLKHSDSGAAQEVEEARRGILAIEGFIVHAVRVGWMGMSEEELAQMRIRLSGVRSSR